MDQQKLRETLQQLHAELEQAQSPDPETQALLRALRDDVQGVLNRAEPEAHHYQTLGERLGDAIEQYEISHPDLTLAMRQVLETLSRAGI